jgi:hypothetical protein
MDMRIQFELLCCCVLCIIMSSLMPIVIEMVFAERFASQRDMNTNSDVLTKIKVCSKETHCLYVTNLYNS